MSAALALAALTRSTLLAFAVVSLVVLGRRRPKHAMVWAALIAAAVFLP